MKIRTEAVTGLLPSRYDRSEIVLDEDHGLWGDRLIVTTKGGAQYTITETEDGNLHLMESGAAALFSHNTSGNCLEVMAVPLFTPRKVEKA